MSKYIIKYKKTILLIFLGIALICGFTMRYSKTNYNMADYLPSKADSTIAMELLDEEFNDVIPNARVMISNVSMEDALVMKEKIAKLEGIESITWLDDVIDFKNLAILSQDKNFDASLLESYYKDSSAIFTITVKKGYDEVATEGIYDLIGEENAAAGNAINMATTQKMSVTEVTNAFLILIPLILIILLLTTTSWIEPLLFLVSIGLAVILNIGTNFILGDVSFVTASIAPILQFAVSLDYAIFLLHSFNREKKINKDINVAMKNAMKSSFSIIIASAVTTMVGFIALLFMRFELGANLGLILVKGIIFSFISVMVLLPALTLFLNKLIEKTEHKSFIPELKKVGNLFIKVRIPFLIIALLLVVPCYISQSKTLFTYGTTSIADASRAGSDAKKIEKVFGKENTIVIMLPLGEEEKEMALSMDLLKTEHITKVMSLPLMSLQNIPKEQLTNQFNSKNYTRIILYTDVPEEGDTTFTLIDTIKDTINKHYDKYYLTGESLVLYDMKNIVAEDIQIVNLIAIVGILVVLLFTFKSFLIPFILVFVIETAIWINLALTSFLGNSLSFVGYLIISTVQLGATVDYAILFTKKYFDNRVTLSKIDAIKKTINENLIAISISATLLSLAGFCLAFTSSNPVVKELGILLGRGTILSFVMVIFVLPALLILFDKWINKDKLKTNKNNKKADKK
ncbi:MAG: MMPL family transporter [Bacilli bacterium]